MAGGTLRAAPGFPRHRFLIEVGGDHDACVAFDPQQKSCNENVGVEDLMLDGSRVANGVRVNDTMGGNLGPDLFFVNFADAGLALNGGHEVMLHEAWFGAVYFPGHTQWAHSLHCRPATGFSEAKRAWRRAGSASQPRRGPRSPPGRSHEPRGLAPSGQ